MCFRNVRRPLQAACERGPLESWAGIGALELDAYKASMKASGKHECLVCFDAIPLLGFTHRAIPPTLGAGLRSSLFFRMLSLSSCGGKTCAAPEAPLSKWGASTSQPTMVLMLSARGQKPLWFALRPRRSPRSTVPMKPCLVMSCVACHISSPISFLSRGHDV